MVERGLLGAHVRRRADDLLEPGVQGHFGECHARRLRDAEVDHLGHRLVVVQGNQHVRGLDVAVDDAFLMGVLDCVADGHEEFEALFGRHLPGVAELGDRRALHQFHYEERPAVGGGADVEDAGDVRVVHHRERLPFRFKAGDDGLGVHPGLDELDRDEPFHGFDLLSHPDGTHAAFADRLEQLVLPGDDGAGLDGITRERRGCAFVATGAVGFIRVGRTNGGGREFGHG